MVVRAAYSTVAACRPHARRTGLARSLLNRVQAVEGQPRCHHAPQNRIATWSTHTMAYLIPAEFVTKMVDAGESKIYMSRAIR